MNKLQYIAVIFLLCIIAILLALNLLKDQKSFSQAHVPIAGELDPNKDPYMKSQVKNAIVKNSGKIQDCYNEFLEREPEKFEGQVKVDWQVKPNGSVSSPEIVSLEFGDDRFKACVVKKISTFSFPPHASSSNKYVVHKFFFRKTDDQK